MFGSSLKLKTLMEEQDTFVAGETDKLCFLCTKQTAA